MSHPHQSTIDLLHALVDRLPPRFPRELGRYMATRLGELERDASISHAGLDRVVAEFGKYTWHYRRAWEEVYQRDGDPDAEREFLAALPSALRERVEQDVAAVPESQVSARPDRSVGGLNSQVSHIVRLPVFERYTPEDRLVIEEALLRARRDAADRLAQRILAADTTDPDAPVGANYDEIMLRWKSERLRIEEELLALKRIARERPPLAGEIQRLLEDYEIGFSGLAGREPTLTELRGMVRDYTNRA